jgi:hypothetical protein
MRDVVRTCALHLPLTPKTMIFEQPSSILYCLDSPFLSEEECVIIGMVSRLDYKLIIMDVFQLIGDFLHLIAMLMLLLKILANKNVIGLSYRTQELYMVVFVTRYSDMILENHWGSLYFNAMRILFLLITAYTIYVMRFKRPYRMVDLSSSRAMMPNRIPSPIGRCTSLREHSPSSSIGASLSMGFSRRFRFGCRLALFCLNYT